MRSKKIKIKTERDLAEITAMKLNNVGEISPD